MTYLIADALRNICFIKSRDTLRDEPMFAEIRRRLPKFADDARHGSVVCSAQQTFLVFVIVDVMVLSSTRTKILS